MPVDRETFAEIMASFPSGVAIVTTLDEAGEPKGLTTSAALIAPAVTVSAAGLASQASDPGIAKRDLQLELRDQKAQAAYRARYADREPVRQARMASITFCWDAETSWVCR